MRILHLYSNWRWTGPAEPALNLATATLRRGHEVVFASGKDTRRGNSNLIEPVARERGVPTRAGLTLNKHLNPFHNYPDGRILRSWLEAEHFDVIHCHLRNDHIIAALAVRRMQRPPAVVRSCYLGEGPHGYWEGRLLREFTDALFVLCERARRQAVDRCRIAPDRVWVLDTSVELDRFSPDRGLGDRRAEWGIAPDAFVVGIVARVQWRRRFHVLLRALALARRELPGLRALIVGRGTHLRTIVAHPIQRLGLQDVVKLTGYQTGDNLVRALATMDAKVLLVPGTDGSCRAVREAMAMGLPIISSRRGLLPDLVGDGERGLVVDDTPENLAAAIVRLARSPDERRAMGARARQYALEHFSLERQAEIAERVYREVIERKRH